VEEAGSAERDGYVAQAEAILAGELPRDPFRPALYPLLAAALAGLSGAPFAAARLLSNAAAAALTALAFGFGWRLSGGSRAVGWWAFAATAANPNLWILGQHVTTDMLFGALAATALLAGLTYLEAPGWRPALAAGAALGLAAFTRSNAALLLPGLLAAWWWARPAGAAADADAAGRTGVAARPRATGRRWGHLALAAFAALALFAPHWGLRAAAFGDPFHDENWKNLAWKLHGHPDWSALERIPYRGPGELLRREAGAIAAGGADELARFARSGLAQLLGTPLHVLLLALGGAAALAFRRRAAAWLFAACALFVGGVALAFFTWGRLLLVLLPPAAGLAFSPWGGRVREGLAAWAGRRLRWRPPPALARMGMPAVAAVAVALLAAKTAFFRLPAFVDRHPDDEVAVLREVAGQVPPGTVLAGTSPFLGRYVGRPYLAVPDAFGAEVGEPGLYYRRLRPLLCAAGARRLVAGTVDLRDRPASLVGDEPPVPWLRPAGGRGRVRVWRIDC
jgi:4-amino-4-deoxy-L-arabinose transferase-like glycosyltransferase